MFNLKNMKVKDHFLSLKSFAKMPRDRDCVTLHCSPCRLSQDSLEEEILNLKGTFLAKLNKN